MRTQAQLYLFLQKQYPYSHRSQGKAGGEEPTAHPAANKKPDPESYEGYAPQFIATAQKITPCTNVCRGCLGIFQKSRNVDTQELFSSFRTAATMGTQTVRP